MAINVNLPKVDAGHDDYTTLRGTFIASTLSANHGLAIPADHANQLFDNMMGFKPHAFAPTDIAHNPAINH
jgi:hypothetical protein